MHAQDKVVIGLGNPGQTYQLTRHNIGFLVAETIVRAKGWSFKEEKRFNAYVAKGSTSRGTLHVLLPTTYMNESGRAVKTYLDYYKLSHEQLIIISDDIALPFGQARVRMMGGPGGHNGLKSVEAWINSSHYVRVKMGVDKNPPLMNLADYVLANFSLEERVKLPTFVEQGAQIVERLLTEDVTHVMNTVNTRLESKPVDLEQRSGEKP